MKVEMNTNWCRLINPGMYETYIGSVRDEIMEEYQEDFLNLVATESKCIMNEILDRDGLNEVFGSLEATDAKVISPRYYNFVNDSLDFTLIVPDNIKEIMLSVYSHWTEDDKYYEWMQKNYGSYSGFISFAPYTKEKFEQALNDAPNDGNYKFNRALAMMIMYVLDLQCCDFDSYQWDLEMAIAEHSDDWKEWVEDEI